MMSPGTYLRLRREAAGLTLKEVTCALACQPEALRPVGATELGKLILRLTDAEADRDNLTVPQASLLRGLFRFDLGIYEALLLRACGVPVPVPQICRSCGCSWLDACERRGFPPCAWSSAQPDLCTACESAPASGRHRHARVDPRRFAPIDWPDAPLPEGAPA